MSINKYFGVISQALELFSTGPVGGSKEIAQNALHCLCNIRQIVLATGISDCPMCKGDGGKILLMSETVVWQECNKCEGKGYVLKQEKQRE